MKQSFLVTVVFIATLISCCLDGCQPLPPVRSVEKDGKVCGVTRGLFRGKWWNHFERGVSFSDCKLWDEAEADFRQALQKKATDQRSVRTFGRHLTDYFPNRELGVVFFHQGRYPEAIQKLETSLSTETSAKAEYYLDRARKQWIRQEKLDAEPPDVFIESPGKASLSNSFTLVVTGMAKDDTYVKEIRINEKPVRIDLAAPQISFSAEVPIQMGENRIVVEVSDLSEKTATRIIKVFCDRAGPVLNIDALIAVNHSDGTYMIRGYAHDDSGIKEIRVNGENILKGPVRETLINHSIVLSDDQKKAVVIAEDQAGNRTRAEIFPSALSPAKRPYNSEDVLLASLDIFPLITQNSKSKAQTPFRISQAKGIMNSEKRIENYKELGTDYALIIGINEYEEWPILKNTVNDATVLKDVLINFYGFSEGNIRLLADKEAIYENLIRHLRYMAADLSKTDNLLIYFSGHGQLDEITGDGYWIPADGKLGDRTTWITNSAIRSIICSPEIKGKNIMVIADSCYSGTLLRGDVASASHSRGKFPKISPESVGKVSRPKGVTPVYSTSIEERLLALAHRKSRQIIASGGVEPVIDDGFGHSLFAGKLLEALKNNTRRVIDIEYLYHTIWQSIVNRGGQRPIGGRLATNDIDEDGQFVLILNSELAVKTRPGKRRKRPVSERRLPDPIPPVIEVRGWDEKRTVFIEQAFLEFNVSDNFGVQKVEINGQKILDRPGRDLYLNYLVALGEGDNKFAIKCTDQMGNLTEKKILIHRKLQKVYEIGSRMSVLVLPFTADIGNTQTLTHDIESNVLQRLFESKRFSIKDLLNPFQADEQDDYLNLARKAGADFVITGKIVAKENSLEIQIGITEAEISQVLTRQDVYGENLDRNFVTDLCQGLVVKLRDALPLIEGRIAKASDEKIMINLGERDRIRPGMHLIFFREGEPIKDPETGEILGADSEELGTARVKELLQKMSHAELLDADALSKLEIGQRLVMK